MLTKGDRDKSIRAGQGGRDNGGGMLMVFTDDLPETGEELDRRLNQRRKPRPGERSPCGSPHLGDAGVCTRCRFLARQPGEPLLAIGLHRGGRGCAYVPAGSSLPKSRPGISEGWPSSLGRRSHHDRKRGPGLLRVGDEILLPELGHYFLGEKLH